MNCYYTIVCFLFFTVYKVELSMYYIWNKWKQIQSFVNFVICDCNSITVPPRRSGICCRMARYDSLLWVMVFSFLGKWNIISLNRDMQNEVSTDPSWLPAQSVGGCWVVPQWQFQLIIETSRSWKSGDLACPTFLAIYGCQYVERGTETGN